MRTTLIFIIAILVNSCIEKQPYSFQEMECLKSEVPEYDGVVVSLLDNETGAVLKDTVIDKIVKTRNIFKPCRQYIYLATFKDKAGSIISNSKVWMMATGKRWKLQPEKQDEVALQFEFSENETSSLMNSFVNKKLSGLYYFSSQETTGIIENVKEVWMHPIRANQYNFTEVAAFPAVKFPLEEGKTWTSNLSIGEGWGDWENTTVYSEYKIVGKNKVKTAFKEFENCWEIQSESTAPFGISHHNFCFDEEYGFVKMEYINYEGQTLVFELVEVIDR